MNNIPPKKAVIIDDHPLAIVAIRSLLEANNISVIAEEEDGRMGLKSIINLKPDIAIIDLDLPIYSGIEIIESLRKKNSTCIVIIVSAKSDYFYGRRCAEAGANAFISKKKGLNDIINAIDATCNGYSYFPFSNNKFIDTPSSEVMKLDSLSMQEVKVMRYLLKGMDISLISTQMKISSKTVSTYKSRLMDKLGCTTLIELYDLAHRNKLG